MDTKLILAIITITLALVFYTIGVFGERRAKTLKKQHVIIFWLGLLCDTTGTTIMSLIARSGVKVISPAAQMLHSITCCRHCPDAVSCCLGHMGSEQRRCEKEGSLS